MTRGGERTWLVFLVCNFILFDLFAPQTAIATDNTQRNGEVLHILILASGLGSTIFYEDGSEGTIQFLKSFVTSQLVTEGLKRVTHKRRPNEACCGSFPSGHASKAFMGAGFIHKRYGLKYAVPAYIAATYVGHSRVHANQHFVEDVVAGAVVGILSSFYFVEKHKGFKVTPVMSNDVYGIYVRAEW